MRDYDINLLIIRKFQIGQNVSEILLKVKEINIAKNMVKRKLNTKLKNSS